MLMGYCAKCDCEVIEMTDQHVCTDARGVRKTIVADKLTEEQIIKFFGGQKWTDVMGHK